MQCLLASYLLLVHSLPLAEKPITSHTTDQTSHITVQTHRAGAERKAASSPDSFILLIILLIHVSSGLALSVAAHMQTTGRYAVPLQLTMLHLASTPSKHCHDVIGHCRLSFSEQCIQQQQLVVTCLAD